MLVSGRVMDRKHYTNCSLPPAWKHLKRPGFNRTTIQKEWSTMVEYQSWLLHQTLGSKNMMLLGIMMSTTYVWMKSELFVNRWSSKWKLVDIICTTVQQHSNTPTWIDDWTMACYVSLPNIGGFAWWAQAQYHNYSGCLEWWVPTQNSFREHLSTRI